MITCLCLYHGRNWCLQEAVECYLRQTDRTDTELYICNDMKEQTIYCNNQQICVENSIFTFTDLSLKYNYAVSQAQGDWVCLWDDDDISLPWRLEEVKDVIRRNPGVDAFYPRNAWYMENGAILNESEHLYAGAATFRREVWLESGGAVINKPPDRSGVESIQKKTKCVIPIVQPRNKIDYIYRWHGKEPHDSAHTYRDNRARAKAFDRLVKEDKRFRIGTFEITPHWITDYTAMTVEAVRKGVPSV